MPNGWAIASIGFHLVTLVAIWALFSSHNVVDPALYRAVVKTESLDALQVATQLGRLDVVSSILAMFGILIGLAAIFGFAEVRVRAKEVAGDVARDEAKTAMDSYLNEKAPAIIRAHVELILPPSNSSTGDAVAAAYTERGPKTDV